MTDLWDKLSGKLFQAIYGDDSKTVADTTFLSLIGGGYPFREEDLDWITDGIEIDNQNNPNYKV